MSKSIKSIFEQTFLLVDNEFVQKNGAKAKKCGSTANWWLILGNRLYWANVGDSRAISTLLSIILFYKIYFKENVLVLFLTFHLFGKFAFNIFIMLNKI